MKANYIITRPSPPKKIVIIKIRSFKNALLKHKVPANKIDSTMQKMKNYSKKCN